MTKNDNEQSDVIARKVTRELVKTAWYACLLTIVACALVLGISSCTGRPANVVETVLNLSGTFLLFTTSAMFVTWNNE